MTPTPADASNSTTTPTCCLCFVLDGDLKHPRSVLLGHKKTGLGAGNIVGLGGHIDPGETAVAATAREVNEESGLVVDEADLDERAYVRYTFPAKPSWDMDVAVFVTNRWHGTIVSCEEITPEWFPIAEVPLDRMWDDARYWQPQVLAGDWTDGELLDVDIVFNDDCLTVASSTITRRARAHS